MSTRPQTNNDAETGNEDTLIKLDYPLQRKRNGVETKLIIGGQALGELDPELIKLIAKGRDWYAGLKTGLIPTIGSIAKAENMDIIRPSSTP